MKSKDFNNKASAGTSNRIRTPSKHTVSNAKTKSNSLPTKPANTNSDSNSNNQNKSTKKSSPPNSFDEHRPRRRASQTHFFKYQLVNNPLKAEEKDLKRALIASLQLCGNSNSNATDTVPQPSTRKSQFLASGKLMKKLQTPRKLTDNRSNSCHSSSSSSNKSNTSGINNNSNSNNNHINLHNITTQNNHNNNHLQADSNGVESKSPSTTKFLKNYKPETEDFLSFICFRETHNASNNPVDDSHDVIDDDEDKTLTTDESLIEVVSLELNDNSVSITANTNDVPAKRTSNRQPTRHSLRLTKKISNKVSSPQSSCEQELAKALDYMAQEMDSLDEVNFELRAHEPDPELIDGLTTEGCVSGDFVGCPPVLADEQTMFDNEY